MKVYQPSAKGPYSCFNGVGTIADKKLFKTREAAEADKARFKLVCEKQTGSLKDISRVDTMYITELELED